MKAFLIDPPSQSVTEIEYDGDWKTIAPMLGCDLFTMVYLNAKQDVVFVDDEGLINGNEHGWFTIPTYPQPLKGRGLVLGTDDMGESTAPAVTQTQLRNQIQFLTDADVRAMIPGGVDSTITVRSL